MNERMNERMSERVIEWKTGCLGLQTYARTVEKDWIH